MIGNELSGGAAPIELAATSIVRTGASLAETMVGGRIYFSAPTGGAAFGLPSIAASANGTQILLRNNSDETITVSPDGTDRMEDAVATLEMAGGAAILFIAKSLEGGVTASWFTFDP